MKLDPTEGHVVSGVRIDANTFLGRVPTAQLLQIAPDPRDTEDKRKSDFSAGLQALMAVRHEVQRLFEGAKRKNVPQYADYLVRLHKGFDGIAPVITLYSEAQLDTDEEEDRVQVPWDQRLVAIDGETQLAARHEAADIEPETRRSMVPIMICHGRDVGWARQAFHDLNTLGVRPNAALSIGMDVRDPITSIAREIEMKIPFFKGRVNKTRRQLKASDEDVVTITSLRGACVTLARGIAGVQYGSRPVDIDPPVLPIVQAAALDWFNAVAISIGEEIEDRANKLAGSPACWAAIGAVGHQLLKAHDSPARDRLLKKLSNSLKQVDWSRGKIWEGIAGKFTPAGTFTAGGAKENAYAVYNALTDAKSEPYGRVRHKVLEAA